MIQSIQSNEHTFEEGQDHACPAAFISEALQNAAGEDGKKQYNYSPLSNPGSIRLLRLVPADNAAEIQCQLFDYPLHEIGDRPCLYEALSYVWGGSKKPKYVSINGYHLPVTANLYTALLHLRDPLIERILWVDALCINQDNLEERSRQVQSMAKIYSKANHVVVWLGDAAADSHHVLEDIRVTADESGVPLRDERSQRAVLALLQRDWFQRIWVLQEVAAARQVLIMCCSRMIDGYVFCLGLQSLKLSYDARPDLKNLIRSVTYLIRGSIFRSKYITTPPGRVSLGIRPLSDLVEMYHTHRATDPRDKVFALLGMCSDSPGAAGLLPNYEIPLEDILRQLVEFLFGREVYVNVWPDTEMVVIRGKGCILGRVSSIEDSDHDDKQEVFITSKDPAGVIGPSRKWSFQISAKPIQVGDLICLLQGALKPTIIRPCKDHFFVIMATITHPTKKAESVKEPKQPKASFPHDYLLIWDWKILQKKLQDQEYGTFLENRVPLHLDKDSINHSDKMNRLWNATLILEDAGDYENAKERLQEPAQYFKKMLSEENLRTLTGMEKLALIYNKLREWQESEKIFKQVVQVRERVQGIEHLDTISSMANLASNYRDQDKFWEASETFEQVLQISERVQGITHPITISSMSNLASVYEFQSRRPEAENLKMLLDALEEKEDVAQRIEEQLLQLISSENATRLKVLPNLIMIQITERMLIAAARVSYHACEILRAFIDMKGKDIQITESVFMAAAGNYYRAYEIVPMLLDQKGKEIQITEPILLTLVTKSRDGERVMKEVLDRKGNEIQINERVLIAAAANTGDMMKLLLDRKGGKIQITESVLFAAASNKYHGKDIIMYFISRKKVNILVSERVLIAAAENKNYHERPPSVVELLLGQKETEVQITERVLIAMAKRGEVLPIELCLERKNYEVQITTPVLIAAAGTWNSDAFRVLFDQRGNEAQITEELLAAAAYNSFEMLRLLFDRGGEEVRITERVLAAAAKNHQLEAVQLVLERRGEEVKTTENILLAAVGNYEKKVLQLLLELKEKELQITENVLIAAVENKEPSMIELVLERGVGEVKLTENLIIAILNDNSSFAERKMISLLGQSGKEVQITERVLLAATKAIEKNSSLSRAKEVRKLLMEHKQRYGI